ncbi:oxidoreductase C-terminal domain-containing protein [Arthrobacter sp.]|uniref:oxidoreductase C-terminal domain-containing protein n=1 Tax=Arthrobacter sp. TaxID=1667 RepID=UPI003392046E
MFCFRNGTLTAVESVNQPADHMAARRLLSAGRTLPPGTGRRPRLRPQGLPQTTTHKPCSSGLSGRPCCCRPVRCNGAAGVGSPADIRGLILESCPGIPVSCATEVRSRRKRRILSRECDRPSFYGRH